jgi:hypothetical protein
VVVDEAGEVGEGEDMLGVDGEIAGIWDEWGLKRRGEGCMYRFINKDAKWNRHCPRRCSRSYRERRA